MSMSLAGSGFENGGLPTYRSGKFIETITADGAEHPAEAQAAIREIKFGFQQTVDQLAFGRAEIAKLRTDRDLRPEVIQQRIAAVVASRSEFLVETWRDAVAALEAFDSAVQTSATNAMAQLPSNDPKIDTRGLGSDARAIVQTLRGLIRSVEEGTTMQAQDRADREITRALEADEKKTGEPLLRLLEQIPASNVRRTWLMEEAALSRTKLEGNVQQRVTMEEAVAQQRQARLSDDTKLLLDYAELFSVVRPLIASLVADIEQPSFFDTGSTTLRSAVPAVLGDGAIAKMLGAVPA